MERHYGHLGIQNDLCNRGNLVIWFDGLIAVVVCRRHNVFHFFSQAVAEMAAIGFGLPKDAFTSLMNQVKFAYLTYDLSSNLFSLIYF